MDRNPPFYTNSATSPKSTTMSSTPFIGAVEDEWQMYSDNPADYSIGDPIGYGSSSIVYAAVYTPPLPAKPTSCALKVLDLDALPPRSLHLLQRETRLMSLSKHPHVLRVRGSWIEGHKLYIALRLMNKGSAADVMRYGWPGGMEEEVCRCILRQALQGLNYLHINGFIHRDVKAANLLIDDDGTVLLGDLGVAADLSEDTSHHPSAQHHRSYTVTAEAALSQGPPQMRPISPTNKRTSHHGRPKMGKRKSFVGTPCWMAPELIQGKQYDSAADIWSFGITAIELTLGRPPRSRDPAKTVLLKTVQEDPPTIDREGGTYRYSRAFKEIVGRCLAKDPAKRPTAADLLQMPFFKGAKKPSYLVGSILNDLPPLTQRQERCLIDRSTVTHRTIDSWDFANTVYSQVSSVRRHAVFDVPAETEEKDVVSAFDHSELDDSAIQESDVSDDEQPSKQTEGIPIPKPSPSVKHSSTPSSFGTSGSTPSSSSSDSPLPTPKSLSRDSLDIEEAGLTPALLPLPRGSPRPISASFKHLYSDPGTTLPGKPMKAPITPPLPSATPHRRPATASSTIGSPPSYPNQPQGIWQKIRTNVRRSSFRGSFGESTAPTSFAGRAMTIFGNGGTKGETLSKSASREFVKSSPSGDEPGKKEQSGLGRLASKRISYVPL